MIRTASFTLASDGKTGLLQVLLDRDGVEYKKLTRAELLYYADSIIRLLVEMSENEKR